jgi:two-component system cell cycle response regulator
MDRETVRVLLIEDNPTAALVLEGLLEAAAVTQYVVTTVGCFAEAQEQLTQQPWDVVLLDLVLPNGEGVELVRRVKGLAPQVPVVIITATDDEELAVGTIREGAQDYLVKGQFEDRQLWRTVRRAIERQKAEAHFGPVRETLARVDRTVAQLQQLSPGNTPLPAQPTPPRADPSPPPGS